MVVVLIAAMVLFMSVLSISATAMLSSRQTIADQTVSLKAQYAAESGLNRATGAFREVADVVKELDVPASTTSNAVETKAGNFCGSGTTPYKKYSLWTDEERKNGLRLCTATVKQGNSQNTIFTAWVPVDAYPVGSPPPGQYWQEMFSPQMNRTAVKLSTADGLEAYYTMAYGIAPESAYVMRPKAWYRFYFDAASAQSKGYLTKGGSSTTPLASKTVLQKSPGKVYIDVKRNCFCKYGQFFNKWPAVYLTGGETVEGPFHSNEPIRLASRGSVYPHFLDSEVSIAGSISQTQNQSRGYTNWQTAASQTFLGGEPSFNADVLTLPRNSYSLQRAVMGTDWTDESTVTSTETTAAYGKDLTSGATNKGIYYSSGTSSTSNTGTAFNGGIYINGDVSSLTLSTNNGNQIIKITQGTKTLTFTESAAGSWSVNDGSTSKLLSNDFNGAIYVNGAVSNLSGDGTNNPDIAADSQITLAATGDVTVKQSITYTEDPKTNPFGENVFGVLTTGGNIIADGPVNQDLIMSGSYMATGTGKGLTSAKNPTNGSFINKGSVLDTTTNTSRPPQIKIIGGEIVDSALATISGSTGPGYDTNFQYDRRFREGLTPPFFPLEEKWAGDASSFADGDNHIWQVVADQ